MHVCLGELGTSKQCALQYQGHPAPLLGVLPRRMRILPEHPTAKSLPRGLKQTGGNRDREIAGREVPSSLALRGGGLFLEGWRQSCGNA